MKKIFIILILMMTLSSSAYSQTLSVADVFKAVSNIDGFQEMDYVEDDIKFPKEIGTPRIIIHGNAEPRDQVLKLLKKLPKGSMIYDNTDERGKFDRIFLNKTTYDLLYVHIGLGGNDSVLILFHDGIIDAIDKFIDGLNTNLPNYN